jgi:hypothetical protein
MFNQYLEIMEEAKFFTHKLKPSESFVILNDILDGYKATEQERKYAKKLNLTQFFELFDDDDNLYYTGYMHEDIEDEFQPLDWAMYDSGCTYMKVRNPVTKKMEIL